MRIRFCNFCRKRAVSERDVAVEVGKRLGYVYPDELDRHCAEYLEKVRFLDRPTKDVVECPRTMMKPDWRQIELENPGFCVRSAALLGEGWNSRVYLVNNELVFRFPKRSEQWEELGREIRFLTFAADDLPLAVPRYVQVVRDSPAAGCGYAVYRYLRGHAMDTSALTEEERDAAADRIAGFLRSLHGLQPGPEIACLLPRDDERMIAEQDFARAERVVSSRLTPREAKALQEQFEIYLGTPGNFLFHPAVLHADLGRDHIVMKDGSVAGVLDFGDVNRGDPDYDFMYLFVDFGQDFAEEVGRRYGHPDLEQLRIKLRYFALADQIGTILDGAGRALEGQEAAAWRRLRELLRAGEVGVQTHP